MIDTKSLVADGKIFISKQNWSLLTHRYDKEMIVDAISDAIDEFNIPFPYKDIHPIECKQDFNALKAIDSNSLIKESGKVAAKFEYDFPLSNFYIKRSIVGNKASNYFHQENRMAIDSVHQLGPLHYWNIPQKRKTLLRGLFSMKMEKVDATMLHTLVNMKVYVASQFKPSVAKTLYELFDAKTVLDMSCGWGDRLAGFSAASKTETYYGIDPSTKSQAAYQEQIEFYDTDKQYTFFTDGSENVRLPESTVDFAFTSPPYFNVEKYSDEETQSWKTFSTFDSWMNHFLFPTIDNAYHALKEGGIIGMNISDILFKNSEVGKICDPMNRYFQSKGSHYVGCLGMEMAVRPNSLASKFIRSDAVYVEPIWLWSKGSSHNLDHYVNRKKTNLITF